MVFFFFKQKTAYEMRISDWSSDVCSSDLVERVPRRNRETRSIPIGTVKGRYLRPFFSSLASLIRITTRPLSGSAFRLSVKPFPSRVAQLGRASCRERVCQYV